MKVILFGLFAVFVASSYGNQHYCGRVLSDALEYMCRTQHMLKQSSLLEYEGEGNAKRANSLQDSQEDGASTNLVGNKETVLKRSSHALDVQGYWPSPWLQHHKALALNSARAKRQGIANECCIKACSVDEMLDYCY